METGCSERAIFPVRPIPAHTPTHTHPPCISPQMSLHPSQSLSLSLPRHLKPYLDAGRMPTICNRNLLNTTRHQPLHTQIKNSPVPRSSTYMQPAPQLSVIPHLHVNSLIQAETNQIQRLLHCSGLMELLLLRHFNVCALLRMRKLFRARCAFSLSS